MKRSKSEILQDLSIAAEQRRKQVESPLKGLAIVLLVILAILIYHQLQR